MGAGSRYYSHMCSNGSGDALAELEAALDRLAGVDLRAMFGPQVLERTRRLLAVRNRLDAQLIRTVREGELTGAPEYDGQKTMASWLRGHARYSAGAAGRLVAAGRALEQLPAVAAAFAAGRITAEQVAVIAPVATVERLAAAEAQGVDVAVVDRLLADTAATGPCKELAQVVQHYRACLDPDGPEPDPTEGRSFTIVTHADGSVSGRFDLDAVGGQKVQAVLESMVQADRPAGDTRSRAQQCGDAFVQWADNTLAAGGLPFLRTVKPHVAALIPLADLADPATGPGAAELGFGGRISAARARWLACDGAITRIVIGPDSQPTGDGPHPPGGATAPAPGHRGPRPALRVHRLRQPQLVVRRPPPAALDRRRRDLAGELRPALRTPPHQGPPRLPGRTTTRRSMAHLAPRRHRNPPPPRNTRRLRASEAVADLAQQQGGTVDAGRGAGLIGEATSAQRPTAPGKAASVTNLGRTTRVEQWDSALDDRPEDAEGDQNRARQKSGRGSCRGTHVRPFRTVRCGRCRRGYRGSAGPSPRSAPFRRWRR